MFLYKIALFSSKKVFFQNIEDMHSFIYHQLITPEKADLLPGSGINFSKFKPQIKQQSERVVFLMIARLVKDKGIYEFVDAARQLSSHYNNVEFQLLGALYPNNPTAITSEALGRWQKDGYINYLGTSDNVADIIAQSDCIVLPSYREGMSHILLEAASMAKPMIASNVPGCMELIDDGLNGFLCHVADYKDLSNKMEKMLRLSPQERQRMGEKSRKKVIEKFDVHVVINKYLDAIKQYS
jgi:glycosyltransferase involved in cell wall biosynthesis